MNFAYYGTQEALPDQEAYHFKKYEKRTAWQSFKNFYIDSSILTPVNLDCQHCRKVHPVTCCEDGQPYSMTLKAEENLAQHASHIIEAYFDPDKKLHAQQHGYTERLPYAQKTASVSVIKKCGAGHCFFLGYDKEQETQEPFCTIHRYAEQHSLPLYDLKPFSCSLFPLDIIEAGGKLYLTALTQETAKFSRWGYEYQHYICVNKQLRETLEPELPYFALESYKPAWKWNRSLLQYYFGVELLIKLEELQASGTL